MIRKAKREGKVGDLEYYLRQGTVIPTKETVRQIIALNKHPNKQLELWKERDHAQHCMAYHVSGGTCVRGRRCAFLHVDSQNKNSFVEQEEVAG